MKQYCNIVVGLDFTDNALNALREAVRLAGRDGKVHAVHVVEMLAVGDLRDALPGGTPAADVEQLERDIIADAQQKLQGMLADVASAGEGARTTAEAILGNPSEALLECATQRDTDLLVMARNSESDPHRGAGSYAVRCVRHATMDVLLVREQHVGTYTHVMAAVDFSDNSRMAAQRAAMIAQRDEAELHLVHAFRPPWEAVPFAAVPMAASGDYQSEHMDMLSSHLEQFAQGLRADYPTLTIKTHLDPAGSIGSTLVQAAESLQADLAVLGFHGRGRIERLLLGSTAERVIRSASCSVLTVRHDEKER